MEEKILKVKVSFKTHSCVEGFNINTKNIQKWVLQRKKSWREKIGFTLEYDKIYLTPHPWLLATYIVLFLKPYFKATTDLQNAWIFVILLSPYIMNFYIDLSKG